MVEPTINELVITWDCADSTNYILTNTELDDTTNLGFVMDVVSPDDIDELDDDDFTNWADSSTLSQDTATKYFGVSSGLASSSVVDISRLILTNLAGYTFLWDCVMFKLNSSIGYTDDCLIFWSSTRAEPFAIVAGYGVKTSVSTSTFSYYNNVTASWTDTGVALDTNWRKIGVYSEDLEATMDFWVNGVKIIKQNSGNTRAFVVRTSQSGKTLNVDRIWHSDADCFIANSTVLSSSAQPTKIKKYLSYSVDDSITEMNLGTITYSFQVSTDGGNNYGTNFPAYDDNNFLTLSDANLRDINCDGDGNDIIRFKATFNSGGDGLHTPLLSQIIINYIDEGGILNNVIVNNAVIQ